MSDTELLAGANAIVADSDLQRAREDLSQARPVLEKMKAGRDVLEDALEAVEESGTGDASFCTKKTLNNALERVGQGQLGADNPSVPMPSYPGLLGIWDYARDVRTKKASACWVHPTCTVVRFGCPAVASPIQVTWTSSVALLTQL